MPGPGKSASPFRYLNSSPEVIRLLVMMYMRFPLSLQKFASIHANVHNDFNPERHLIDRKACKTRYSAALAE